MSLNYKLLPMFFQIISFCIHYLKLIFIYIAIQSSETIVMANKGKLKWSFDVLKVFRKSPHLHKSYIKRGPLRLFFSLLSLWNDCCWKMLKPVPFQKDQQIIQRFFQIFRSDGSVFVFGVAMQITRNQLKWRPAKKNSTVLVNFFFKI